MNENLLLIESWNRLRATHVRSALATVIRVKGSSYRREGAKMLVSETGEIFGRVSGGCLERDLILRAQNAIRKAKQAVVQYDTSKDADDTEQEAYLRSAGLGCEGVIEILIDPFPERVLPALSAVLEKRKPLVTVIPLQESPTFQFYGDTNNLYDGLLPDGPKKDFCLREMKETLAERKPRIVEFDGMPIFFDVLSPPQELYLFGAGFDAVAMARLSYELGYHTIVVDTRSSFPVGKRHFASISTLLCCDIGSLSNSISLSPNACAVVMTHQLEHDKAILKMLLSQSPIYIGLLGPRTRGLKILQHLESEGIVPSPELAQRIYSPIGLDIGGDGPQAIALSILAEIQSVLSQRRGGSLRERPGSIH